MSPVITRILSSKRQIEQSRAARRGRRGSTAQQRDAVGADALGAHGCQPMTRALIDAVMRMLREMNASFRFALCLCVASTLAACGGNPAPSDASDTGVSTDSGVDVATMDAASEAAVDVVAQDQPSPDAPNDVVRPDSACDPVAAEGPMPMGVCDGRGMIACAMWAQQNAGGNPNARSICMTTPSGCARADRCTDTNDPSTCRCGGDPACAPGNVCVEVGPTAVCRPLLCR